MLKISIPSGKSLQERTLELFAETRIYCASRDGAIICFNGYPDLEVGYLVKPRRIPLLVQGGDVDVGITGSDAVLESGITFPYMEELAYSKVTDAHTEGVLFAHKSDPVCDIESIPEGSIILSEYPNITRRFFSSKKHVVVEESPGSAEAEVPLRYRFGVALSETGRSLKENQLKKIVTLFRSSTVLIANERSLKDDKKYAAIHMLGLLLKGALAARRYMSFAMNVPESVLDQVMDVLPALGSPTVSRLFQEHHYAVSAVVPTEEVNTLIPKLIKVGARGIIVTPISSIIHG